MRARASLRLVCALAVLAALAAAAAAGSASAIPDGATVLIDRPSGFGALPFDGVATAFATPYSVSANGRYVVFTSNNSSLLPNDDDRFFNVYRVDLQSVPRKVELVSQTKGGSPANSDSFSPSISSDGRYVAFSSTAGNLAPGLSTTNGGVLVKDMQTGDVELASHGDDAGDNGPTNGAFDPVISGDGRAVAFLARGALSGANADSPAGFDDNAFIRLLGGTPHTYLLSVKGGSAAGVIGVPAVPSYDGTAAVFASSANIENATESQPDPDAYLVSGIGGSMSLQLASTTLGSNSKSTSVGDGVALSSDGKHVAWVNNFVWENTCDPTCGPTNNQEDFLASGTPAGQRIFNVAFPRQPDGTTAPTVEFWTTDGKLKSADTNDSFDMYSHQWAVPGEGGLALLTGGEYTGGATGGGSTDDGSTTAFNSATTQLQGTDGWQTQVFTRRSGESDTLISQQGTPRRVQAGTAIIANTHAVSVDGSRVAFSTQAPAFGAPVIGGFPVLESFVRDTVSGQTIPVTRAADGAPANSRTDPVTIDRAGDRVAFSTSATNLAAGVVPNGREHAYLRDLGSGELRLLDRGPDGKPVIEGADGAVISGDGGHVVFRSQSHNLDGNDGMGFTHIFELDLATGKFKMADRTQNGTIGNGFAGQPDVSDDGRFVAFVSPATNLGGGTVAGKQNVYVKDLRTGVLTWASIPEDGKTDHSNAVVAALSGDGTHVAFLVIGDAGFGYGGHGDRNLYVRDLVAARTTLVSSTPETANASGPSLSTDGSRIAFTTFDANAVSSVWTRALPAGAPVEVTPRAREGAVSASMNALGTCFAFNSRSNDLVSGGYGPTYFHVYLHAFGADCPATGAGNARPVASRFRMTHRKFAVARGRTRAVAGRRVPRGTKFKFRLSENATSTITIHRMLPGRKKGKRCVKPRRGLRKRCTRFVRAAKLVRRNTKQGANTVAYTGRIRKKALKPGRYRATLVAKDSAGLRSKPRRLRFRVVRATRR